MRSLSKDFSAVLAAGMVFLLVLISGCLTLTNISPPSLAKPIFFPPAPDPPRLQYLFSFSSSKDLEPPPSVFKNFVVGQEDNIKPIIKPYGIAVYDDKIYVCDTVLNAICLLDLKTKKFSYFLPQEGPGLLSPINLAVAANGDLYVADARRGQVLIFDQQGNSLGAIGKKSELKPTAVALKEDKIYVTDLKSHSLRVYRAGDRQFLLSIPQEGEPEQANLFSPANLALDQQGNLYVSDIGAFRVQKYSPSGKYLMTIGSHGDALGQFARPKGIALDRDGRLFVVDAAFENVQIFDPAGKLLLFFAEPGASPVPLVLPSGIAIDYTLRDYFSGLAAEDFKIEYLVLVASQYGERKLSVFAFGHQKDIPASQD